MFAWLPIQFLHTFPRAVHHVLQGSKWECTWIQGDGQARKLVCKIQCLITTKGTFAKWVAHVALFLLSVKEIRVLFINWKASTTSTPSFWEWVAPSTTYNTHTLKLLSGWVSVDREPRELASMCALSNMLLSKASNISYIPCLVVLPLIKHSFHAKPATLLFPLISYFFFVVKWY